MRQFGVAQRRGDDANYTAAGRQRCVCGDAHQPDPAAAIDQLDAGCRQASTGLVSRGTITLIDSACRTAIYANGSDLLHQATAA
jgi:hypothetical protein